MGAVEIGEDNEALHTRAELSEAEPFGQLQQRRREVAQPIADSAVGVGHGEFVGLRCADVALVERFGEAGDVGGRGAELTDACCLGVGVAARCSEVGLQRAVSVVELGAATVDFADGHGELGFDPAALQLEGANTLVEVGVAALHQLLHEPLDRRVLHASHLRRGVSHSCVHN